jgi:hypothetical protein
MLVEDKIPIVRVYSLYFYDFPVIDVGSNSAVSIFVGVRCGLKLVPVFSYISCFYGIRHLFVSLKIKNRLQIEAYCFWTVLTALSAVGFNRIEAQPS